MKISSLVLASSAHAAWEDKWNTAIAGRDEGYVDFQLRGKYSFSTKTASFVKKTISFYHLVTNFELLIR